MLEREKRTHLEQAPPPARELALLAPPAPVLGEVLEREARDARDVEHARGELGDLGELEACGRERGQERQSTASERRDEVRRDAP